MRRVLLVSTATAGIGQGERLSVAVRCRLVGSVLAACAVGLLFATSASAAVAPSSLESPAVREVLSHQLQLPGPAAVSQGGSGSGLAVAPPSGDLVPSLSSAFSSTWSAPNKPLVTRIFSTPVNFKGSDGQWRAIDNTLAASPLGGYENAANSFSLRLPDSLSAAVSLTAGGRSLSFTLLGAAASLPSVSGTAATYHDVLPSTDLMYVSQDSGVREIATLKDASAPTRLQYSLSLPPGLAPRQAADGSISIVDEQGTTWFAIPAPAASRPDAGPNSGRQLPSSIAPSASGWLLTVDTSEAWLRNELSTGAVSIDPTVLSASQGCSLQAETPTNGWCASPEQRVGYDSTHTENHSVLKFDVSSLPLAATILNAKLGLYVEAHTTSNSKAVGVYRVIKPWTTSANWETYDGTHAWTTKGGDYANPEANSDASVNSSVGASTGWYYWYPTRMVQEWVNTTNAPEFEKKPEGYANEGLIVKDQTDNTTQNMLSIRSPNATANKPFLEVAYEPRGQGSGPQYTTVSTALTDRSSMSVNPASGNLSIQANDLGLSGVAGFGFSSTRTWNSLNTENQEYGHWSDSNANESILVHFADGTVALESASGAWFTFIRQPDASFITPPGIKAIMCERGSPAPPCPTSAELPSGVKFRLIYDQSQAHGDYNEAGTGLNRQDRYGNTIKREFPSKEHMLYTDTRGHKIEELSNSETWITEIKDLSGARNTKYAYEKTEAGTVLKTYTDANEKKTTYGYGGSKLTSITDPVGNVTKFAYDSQHRVTEIIRTTNSEHTTGPTTKFTYYEPGAAPAPCTSKQRGTLIKDPDWTAEKAHETLYCSNVLDEVEQAIDAEKHESKVKFDPFGNTVVSTAPERETGASAGVTTLVYGTAGQNLECVVEGTKTEMTTCPGKAEPEGYATEYAHKDGTFPFQPTEAISARREKTSLCYWGGETACVGETEGTSEAKGALRHQHTPLASENDLNYEYNKNGTISASSDADKNKTTYKYDASGNLETITPPSGSGLGTTTITVDSLSRAHTITQCVGSGGSCTSSQVATLTYDKLDRVTEAVDTGPGATKTFKYTYDADGNLEKRVDPVGTTTYTRDPLSRITEEALPGSLTNAYSYDAASNLISFTDAGGGTHYFYNGLNQLESMYEPGGTCSGTPSKCTHATYDGAGSLSKVEYPSKATVNYGVDPTSGRPVSITAKGPGGETLLSHAYTYKNGINDTPLIYKDVYTQGAATDTTNYGYDGLDRLLKAATSGTDESIYEYALDGAGNRTKQTINPEGGSGGTTTYFRYNAGNELECRMKTNEACTKSATNEISGYSYDGAGNETAITGYNDPASTTFSYNNLSQLKGLTPPSLTEQAVSYLGSGQSSLTGLGSITLQNSLLGLTKQTNEVGTSYYARTASGIMLDERLPGSTSYNPIYDSRGDTIGLLSTSGALVQTLRYSPYGDYTTKSSGSLAYSPTNDPFLFQGGYHVPGGNAGLGNVSPGLYHYGARYYDPTSGRWTQPDPVSQIADPSESAGYGFAGDDPVNMSDPSGLSLECDLNPGCAFLHKVVSWAKNTGLYRKIDEATVSLRELQNKIRIVFDVAKEIVAAGKCLYELAKSDGAANCGSA